MRNIRVMLKDIDVEIEIDISTIDSIEERDGVVTFHILDFPMKHYIVCETLKDIAEKIEEGDTYAWQYIENEKMPDWIKELIIEGKLIRDEEGLSTSYCQLILDNDYILWDGNEVAVLDELVFNKLFY